MVIFAIFWPSVAEDRSLSDEADLAKITILTLVYWFGP
jgi:hypothetical protein